MVLALWWAWLPLVVCELLHHLDGEHPCSESGAIVEVGMGALEGVVTQLDKVEARHMTCDDQAPSTWRTDQVMVINLKRRNDRLHSLAAHLRDLDLGLGGVYRFPGFDGKARDNESMRDNIADIFSGNEFGNSPGVLGCAMSHLLVWRQLVLSSHSSYMVLEDDVRLVEGFASKWPAVMDKIAIADPSWDIVYLGMHGIEKDTFVHPSDEVNEHFLRLAAVPNHEGSGTHGYAISRSGAAKFLSLVWTRHIKEQIDMFMMAALPHGTHMHVTRPALALAAAWTADNEFGESDSDVQRDLYAWANADSSEKCIFATFTSKLGIVFGEAGGKVS
jgi:GR25 family glycosyltransferase involved in LPS biosynthesis